MILLSLLLYFIFIILLFYYHYLISIIILFYFIIIFWLNYPFGPSICHEISVWSLSFSLSQFVLIFLKMTQFGPHR